MGSSCTACLFRCWVGLVSFGSLKPRKLGVNRRGMLSQGLLLLAGLDEAFRRRG